MTTGHRATVAVRTILTVLLLLYLPGLSEYVQPLPKAQASTPVVLPVPNIDEDVLRSRGHLVRMQSYDFPSLGDQAPMLGRSWRAVYASVSGIDGGLREVSGAFFIPRGSPPAGGWPAISLAHGTTGIGNDCGPGRQPDLQGYGAVIGSLLAAGYAVAMSDYEGLGPRGSHAYLEPLTAAFNTIDAVRALQEISADVSSFWVGVGYSQGGQATWAANELDSLYGSGLKQMGSVALAPAANVTGVVDLAWSMSMTDEQRRLYPLLVSGLARYNPALHADAFLRGPASTHPEAFRRCDVVTDPGRPSARAAPVPVTAVERLAESGDMRPATADDAGRLRDALRRIALPQRALGAPMLVITGLGDSLVLSQWVAAAVSQSCGLGGDIEYEAVPIADHDSILWRRSNQVMAWIADRFAGAPAPSNCAAR